MLNFLNNPWVSGILGGIISGLIVYFITDYILSRKQNKEYNQRITTGNNELLYMLRPLIAQKQILSDTVFNAMIASTAKKYDVNVSDLGNIKTLSSDLIREVLENAFLDSNQKIQFCEEIEKWSNEEKSESKILIEKILVTSESMKKNQLSSQYMSAMLAVTASLTTLSGSFFTVYNDKFSTLEKTLDRFGPVFTSITLPLIAIMMVFFIQKVKSKTRPENIVKDNEKELE